MFYIYITHSEILAHFVLKERLNMFGVIGIVLCVIGSVGVVVHAPQERTINSVKQLWHLALQPGKKIDKLESMPNFLG